MKAGSVEDTAFVAESCVSLTPVTTGVEKMPNRRSFEEQGGGCVRDSDPRRTGPTNSVGQSQLWLVGGPSELLFCCQESCWS